MARLGVEFRARSLRVAPTPGTALTRRHVLAGAGAVAIRGAWPPAAHAQAADDGWTVLRAQAADPGSDRPPGLWTFNGSAPGPVLRAHRGEEVKVHLVNALPHDLTLHWHGVRLVNAMDGVPYLTQAPAKAGASFDYRFVAPDAGTYWYHPVLDRPSAPPGLSGALIIEETEPVEVDRELVLILDTRRGPEGTGIFANGQPALDIPVRPNERLRLRVINAALADAMALRLGQHRPVVMAIDGQPAEPFTARDGRVALGPGNRADLFIDLILPPGTIEPITLTTMWGDTPIGRFLYSTEPMRRAPLPDPKPLAANALPARIDLRNAHRMTLPLAEAPPWIDAKSALSGRPAAPLFSVKRGRAVMLTLTNPAPKNSAIGFAVHLHGHHARLLDNLDDGWKPYWLDTVVVASGQTARIAFVADNPGKWLLELQSFASFSAVTWFEVT